MTQKASSLKVIALLLGLSFCWGPSFLFIKIALTEMPPFTLVAARLTLGAVLLYLILRFQGSGLWAYRQNWRHFVVMGFFACAFPFFMITLGETSISSSLAAIINSTTPIWTVILAHLVGSEKISWNKGFGVLVGFLGILLIFYPALIGHRTGEEWGAFLVFLSAVSYAVAMIYAKKNCTQIPSMVGATAQVICAALMLLPFSLLSERAYELPWPSTLALSGIVGLSILGTAIAFPIYYTLGRIAGPTILSTSTLLFPVIGVFLGVLILEEPVTWNDYAGSATILFGLAVSNGLINFSSMKLNGS